MIQPVVPDRFLLRDGLQLRYAREIALPVYRLRLRAITILHKGIPPIEEFALRAILLGIDTMTSITAFLGLEERVLQPALVSLAESGDISVLAGDATESTFVLTAKGRVSSEKHVLSSTEERAFAMFFDALLRKSVWHQNENLIEYQEIRARGLLEITQYPSTRPKTGDLRLSEIDSIVKSLQHSPDVKRDLVAIRGIESCRKWFQPALALVYSQDEGSELQLGIVIDGKLSQLHERLVWESHRFEEYVRNQLAIKAQEDEVIELRRENAPQIESSITIQTAITAIQSQKSELTARISDPQEQTSEAKLKERLEGLEAEISRLKAEAEVLPVKNLYMQDHPSLLNDALENAKERLLIISPWIRARIVTEKFLRQLEAVLMRGAQVHIGHGIAPNSTRACAADVTAKQAIESLAGGYSNLHFVRLGNTHAKILIKDHDFAAVTSFNWLSFRGDPNQAYRDEQGVLLQKQDLVDAKYDEVIKQFPIV